MSDRPENYLVSFVLPLFNENSAILELVEQIRTSIEHLDCRHELVFVNDGSTDGSGETLDQLAQKDSQVRVIHFSRNFGHQPAVQAGLAHSSGDAVIVMDTDLQDDPRSLPDLIEKWREGYDVVYAIREKRKENAVKRAMFYLFYRLINLLSDLPIPKDVGNFGLMDKQVAKTVAAIPDFDRFFAGLRCWVGFRQTGIVVERLARYDEKPRVSWLQLFQLAKSAIFSFSRAPLALFYSIAVLSMLVCGFTFMFVLYHKLVTGLAVPGWTSIAMTASFFGALNALGISILGEYVVRTYDQVRNRPQFIIESISDSSPSKEDTLFEDSRKPNKDKSIEEDRVARSEFKASQRIS